MLLDQVYLYSEFEALLIEKLVKVAVKLVDIDGVIGELLDLVIDLICDCWCESSHHQNGIKLLSVIGDELNLLFV